MSVPETPLLPEWRYWPAFPLASLFLIGLLGFSLTGHQKGQDEPFRPVQGAAQVDSNKDYSWWEYSATWTNVFSFVLTVSTVGLWYYTRKSADAAKLAVQAAMLQAESLIAIEQPVVVVAGMRLSSPPSPLGDDDGADVVGHPGPISRVTVTFKNAGRTAATTSRLCLNWKIVDELPEQPVYERISDFSSVIQADGTLEYTPKTMAVMPSGVETKMMQDGRWQLWVYGFLEFTDFAGTRFTLGFARVWDVARGIVPRRSFFASEDGSKYEYYRKEVRPK